MDRLYWSIHLDDAPAALRTARISEALRSIGANVRRLRLKNGWTQAQLAERVELEDRYVRSVEAGQANPSAETLLLLADAFGVLPGVLFKTAKLGERRPGRPSRRKSKARGSKVKSDA